MLYIHVFVCCSYWFRFLCLFCWWYYYYAFSLSLFSLQRHMTLHCRAAGRHYTIIHYFAKMPLAVFIIAIPFIFIRFYVFAIPFSPLITSLSLLIIKRHYMVIFGFLDTSFISSLLFFMPLSLAIITILLSHFLHTPLPFSLLIFFSSLIFFFVFDFLHAFVSHAIFAVLFTWCHYYFLLPLLFLFWCRQKDVCRRCAICPLCFAFGIKILLRCCVLCADAYMFAYAMTCFADVDAHLFCRLLIHDAVFATCLWAAMPFHAMTLFLLIFLHWCLKRRYLLPALALWRKGAPWCFARLCFMMMKMKDKKIFKDILCLKIFHAAPCHAKIFFDARARWCPPLLFAASFAFCLIYDTFSAPHAPPCCRFA